MPLILLINPCKFKEIPITGKQIRPGQTRPLAKEREEEKEKRGKNLVGGGEGKYFVSGGEEDRRGKRRKVHRGVICC